MSDERSLALRDDEIEAEARAILRKTILRSRWYPELRSEEREKRIEQDVDRYWLLMRAEVVKRLKRSKASSPNSGWV